MIWSLSVGMVVFMLSALSILMGAIGFTFFFHMQRKFDMPADPDDLVLVMMAGVMFCVGLLGIISLMILPSLGP